MKAKTGPKPRPPETHFKRLTITVPPEMDEKLRSIAKERNQNVSSLVVELLELGLIYIEGK